jgi:hypothetical protein
VVFTNSMRQLSFYRSIVHHTLEFFVFWQRQHLIAWTVPRAKLASEDLKPGGGIYVNLRGISNGL